MSISMKWHQKWLGFIFFCNTAVDVISLRLFVTQHINSGETGQKIQKVPVE